jgi:hypothetical protein
VIKYESFKFDPDKNNQQNGRRRVTINDHGRIKYPSDSISHEMDYILPEEFRVPQSTGRKRPL